MKRTLLLVVLCLLSFPAHAQTTVTGHLKDASGAAIPGSATTFVRFELLYCGANEAKVNGVVVLPGNATFDKQPDANGLISIPAFYGNDVLTCGTTLGATRWQTTPIINGTPGVSCRYNITGATWDLNTQLCDNATPAPTPPAAVDSTYFRLDAGNSPITGTTVFSTGINTKKLNSIRFADQFSGADCGAQINAADADLSTAAGEIWVMGPCSISTPVVLGASHVLKFKNGYTELFYAGCNITLNTGSGVHGSNFGISNGTILRGRVAAAQGICFGTNAQSTKVSDIGFDGFGRSRALGAAITLGNGHTRNYVSHVAVIDWLGTVISLGGAASDNHFDQITMSAVGSVTGSKPAIGLTGSTNSNHFSGIQIDSHYYAGIQQGSSQGGNLFSNIKLDSNAATPGAYNVLYTSAQTGKAGDQWSNFTFRSDSNGVGDCIRIDGAITDLKFANGYCSRPEVPGASNVAFNVNSATASGIKVSNFNADGFAIGIRDISAGHSNSYINVSLPIGGGAGQNTAATSLSNPQVVLSGEGGLTGVTSVTVGASGTELTRYARYSKSLSPAQVAANTCAAEAVSSVTGVTSSDILIGITKPTEQAGLSVTPGHVTGTGALTLNFCNNTAAPITPTGSETYQFVVVQ
jgi:hypothetical protein